MKKFDQLRQRLGTFHTYYKLELDKNGKYIDLLMTWNPALNPLIRVYENDDFELPSMNFLEAQGNERNATLSCMPFPVIMDKKRNGMFINDELWTGRTLRFNSNGDCINHIDPPVDNQKLRRQFNKFMLNWQKEVIIMARMKPPMIPNLIIPTGHKLFVEAPTSNTVSHISHNAWTYNNGSLEDKIRDIKNYRTRYQNKLYQEFLKGEHPQITNFGKE